MARQRRGVESEKKKGWIFPSKDYMKQIFPVLKRAPFLIVFCWGIRGGVFSEKDSGQNIGKLEKTILEKFKRIKRDKGAKENEVKMKLGKKIFAGFAIAVLASLILVYLQYLRLIRWGGCHMTLYQKPFVSATESMRFSKHVHEIEAVLYSAMLEKNIDKYETQIRTDLQSTQAKAMKDCNKLEKGQFRL